MCCAEIQSYIHDANVSVVYKRKIHSFVIFIKNHKQLPQNLSVARLVGGAPEWRGDIVIIKRGVKEGLVNIQREDNALADFAVGE